MWKVLWRGLTIALAVVSLPAGRQQLSQARLSLKQLERAYSIEILTENPGLPDKTPSATFTGKAARSKAVDAYAEVLFQEFALYPPALTKRVRIKRIVLCEELAVNGQLRAAAPNWKTDTLYLDVTRGKTSGFYQNRTLHHEFFHMIDFADDGKVYSDPVWAALNPGGFQYGSGGVSAQDIPSTSLPSEAFPGFLNHYGTTGIEEDKAELFTYLMVHPRLLSERCSKDPVLKGKTEKLKQMLAAFCPELNEAFWLKVAKFKRVMPLQKGLRATRPSARL